MEFSKTLLAKYNMLSLEEYKKFKEDTLYTEITFYQTFLIQTDHIPNKIIEYMIENLIEITPLNFIEKFIDFIKIMKFEYKEILEARKFSRQKINELMLLINSTEEDK